MAPPNSPLGLFDAARVRVWLDGNDSRLRRGQIMDPISPATRREALHDQITDAQMVLRRAAAAAALKSDPLAEQLHALAGVRRRAE